MRATRLLVLMMLGLLGLSCEGPPAGPGASAQQPGGSDGSEDEDRVPRSAEEALRWLLEGNERFASGNPEHDHESLRRRAMLVGGQKPFTTILGCADSRVPPELLFDSGLGDMFVIRVAGNVLSEDEAGSIEYAIEHLEVLLIVVLGHERCGAVTAALKSFEDEPEELKLLLKRLRPAVAGIDPALPTDERIHQGVEANVRQTVRQIRAIQERENRPEAHRVRVVGAVYELETGRVRILDDTFGEG